MPFAPGKHGYTNTKRFARYVVELARHTTRNGREDVRRLAARKSPMGELRVLIKHGDATVRSFMEGLLPDNAAILERWARQFHGSPRNPYALLS